MTGGRFGALALALAGMLLAAGCVRSLVKPKTEGTDGFSSGASGERTIDGVLEDKEELATEIPVTLSADRSKASLEIDGRIELLQWTGEQPKRCACRFYRNERFGVMVELPGKGRERATVMRLADEDEPVVVDAVLREEDGLGIKTRLRVADDQGSVSFDHEGENYTLAWDKKPRTDCTCRDYESAAFRATVHFPNERHDGRATVEHRH